ncbi:hypothetical protein BH23PLA1_BH23PLA1_18950 [soil metagenome]
MSALSDFLDNLFREGTVVFRDHPALSGSDRAGTAEVLRRAFDEDCLDLAGAPPTFDEAAAVEAAEWTRMACWFMVHREEPVEELKLGLTLPKAARSPGAHLSADLTFRYLPLIHRRARALSTNDLLTRRLAELLRQWPLTGVLSDVEEAPIGPVDWTWDGHFGLMLLYAERLAVTEKPAWCPTGKAFECVEWVLDGLGRRGSPLLRGQSRGVEPIKAQRLNPTGQAAETFLGRHADD